MALNFLKKEINNKKRKAEEMLPPAAAKGSQWVTRGELEKKREMEYMAEQAKLEEERRIKLAKLAEIDDAERELSTSKASQSHLISMLLPREEVIARLKARREPITYFGETDLLRAERLRKLELMEPTEFTEGSTNEFARSIKEVEDEAAEEAAQAQKIEKEDPLFVEELRTPESDDEKVLFWIRRLLAMMQRELDNRPEEVKRSGPGKREVAIFKQTQSYIRPLMAQLASKGKDPVPSDIFAQLLRVTRCCEARDYKMADQAYYELAIGNAAWPMGVTMVGIHERSAREKISASSVAHVLNDETQRKYITVIKRLITFHGKRFPAPPVTR
jgi:pre-mRNA-splicing factor 18